MRAPGFLARQTRAGMTATVALLLLAAATAHAQVYGGGVVGGGPAPVPTNLIAPANINQTQGTTTNCNVDSSSPGGCSTSNPATAGIDPTNATYGAKPDAKGSGEWFGSQPQTTSSASITSSATTLQVASAVGFPTSGQFNIFVDTMSSTTTVEEMTVTGGQGTTSWTVTRGVNGTTGVAHNAGVLVLGMGDGSWNYNDSSCGTAHQCFNSTSGQFNSGDVGKVISINGLSDFKSPGNVSNAAFLGTPPFAEVCPGGTYINTFAGGASTPGGCTQAFITISGYTSPTEVTISAVPPLSTANQLFSGLAWVAGTDDRAAFQSAINAGDLHIPRGFYMVPTYSTSQGFPNLTQSSITVPQRRDIWCDNGATIINPTFDLWYDGVASVFYSNSNGEQSLRNCTIEGTNIGMPGYPNLDGTQASNAQAIYILGTSASGGPSGYYILGNSFKYWWGQSIVEVEPSAVTDYNSNVQIIQNNFSKCGLYGPVFISAGQSGMAYNTLTDCSIGAEPNGNQTNYPLTATYYVGNTMNCVYGSGAGFTYITGIDQPGFSASGAGIDVFDNTASGVSFLHFCGYDANVATPPANYYNNQVLNGATWVR